MKRTEIIICAVSLLLALSGCSTKPSSAPDYTAAPTDRSKKAEFFSEKYPVRAVMIDGYLYYETGKENETGKKSRTTDGTFVKTVNEYEIPQNNNESNFDTQWLNSYQLGASEDTVEIQIGDDLEIFSKIYDPEKDLSQYKYIMKVEGETEYSFGDAEYIVLTNDMDITANDIAQSLLSSQYDEILDIYIVSFEDDK